MNKKIAVLGTGANGSCVAADLVGAGLDVVLIDQWPAHIEAMRAEGLRISLPDEERHVRVRAHHLCDLATLNDSFDVVLLVMKAYDTRWACEFIKPHLKDDGLLVGLQNAMTAGAIADIVGPTRTLGCIVELSSEIFTPGTVQRNTPYDKTWFGIGSMDAATAGRESEIEPILAHVGKVSVSADVLAGKWMKLVVNSMSMAPFAMLGLRLSEALDLPGVRELAVRVGAEALELGQHLGYRIEPIFGLKPEDVEGSNRLLENFLEKLNRDLGPKMRDCVTQDYLKGRYTEVDMINGLVVAESRRLGKPAPANAAMVEIARRIHSGALIPNPANLDLAHGMLAN
jgi:2-dehydropantoate 2-reductase